MTPTTVRDRTTLWKSIVIAFAAVLLVAVLLPASARADDEAAEATLSSREVLTDLMDNLRPADPNDAEAAHRVDKAFAQLMEVLDDDAMWASGEPGAKGSKIFSKGAKAIKELVKAGMPDDALALVGFFRGLADDAMAAGGGDKAAKRYAKAEKELDKGKLDKAVTNFGKAWKDAKKNSGSALAAGLVEDVEGWLGFDFELDSGLDGFNDAGYVYSFQFVHRTTGEFLIVSGFSQSNEGFLASTRFADADSELPGAGQMQVHVSCSDAFANGVGQKSDPTAESQWLVDYARIVKYSNGEVAKSCLLTGKGTGIQLPIGGNIG